MTIRSKRIVHVGVAAGVLGAFALTALMLALVIACAGSSTEGPSSEPRLGEVGGTTGSIAYLGPSSLEERIAGADLIVKARLRNVTTGIERWDPEYINITTRPRTSYIPVLKHNFAVLEYLKGTGDDQVIAVVYNETEAIGYASTGDASAAADAFLASRDTQYDGRDAIIFLTDTDKYGWLPDFPKANHYILGFTDYGRGDWYGDYYTIASPNDKAWLPSTAAGTGRSAGRSSRDSQESQRFLLDEPSGGGGASGAEGASGQSQANDITLADMKAKISAIKQEVAQGDGSDAYRECVYEKYAELAFEAWRRATHNSNPSYTRLDGESKSGQPANSLVYRYEGADKMIARFGTSPPADYGRLELLRNDAALFSIKYPGEVYAVRPLPAGEYRFFYNRIPQKLIPCNGQLESRKSNFEMFVTVTAPTGTHHEAFFDPVSSGDAVGYFGTGDTLKPTSFDMGGVSIAIQSLSWEDNAVTLGLSPYNALTGQVLDFIALDGTGALSLDASTAIRDSRAGTLTWALGNQPWSSGVQLMFRLGQSNVAE